MDRHIAVRDQIGNRWSPGLLHTIPPVIVAPVNNFLAQAIHLLPLTANTGNVVPLRVLKLAEFGSLREMGILSMIHWFCCDIAMVFF